jgi:hypothetical protein
VSKYRALLRLPVKSHSNGVAKHGRASAAHKSNKSDAKGAPGIIERGFFTGETVFIPVKRIAEADRRWRSPFFHALFSFRILL